MQHLKDIIPILKFPCDRKHHVIHLQYQRITLHQWWKTSLSILLQKIKTVTSCGIVDSAIILPEYKGQIIQNDRIYLGKHNSPDICNIALCQLFAQNDLVLSRVELLKGICAPCAQWHKKENNSSIAGQVFFYGNITYQMQIRRRRRIHITSRTVVQLS